MRLAAALVLVISLAFSPSAHAWFFFFIPGSALRAIGDAATGAKGNICVKEGTQVGQILNSPNGNSAKVLSVSGTSSICQNPALPIRAELGFTYRFSSKAGIELSDDFQPATLTDLERFNGFLLKAASKSKSNHGIQITATTKKPNSDIRTMANNIEQTMQKSQRLKDVASDKSESLTINGAAAVRFEIAGTLNSLFSQRITYLYTILEGDDEIVIVNVYGPADFIESHRLELQQAAGKISGLHAPALAPQDKPSGSQEMAGEEKSP